MNAINVISPYKYLGMWVFDDERVGLVQEPFVAGADTMIDRVVAKCQRRLMEVPVGFKWFAPGLFDGSVCFGGEESAGASFLRRDGTVWTTDKDGPIMDLLAAEITAALAAAPIADRARTAGKGC